MSLFDFAKDLVKNVAPKGTFIGDALGSTRQKGSGVLGVHVGKKKYRERYEKAQKAKAVQTSTGKNSGATSQGGSQGGSRTFLYTIKENATIISIGIATAALLVLIFSKK